jgi:hypothetical protein
MTRGGWLFVQWCERGGVDFGVAWGVCRFNGIMFDLTVPDILPIDFVRVTSVAVRGGLGPMSVYISTKPQQRYTEIFESPELWKRIYSRDHNPSPHRLVDLKFDEPLVFRPGETRAMYVHSANPGDSGIVYVSPVH